MSNALFKIRVKQPKERRSEATLFKTAVGVEWLYVVLHCSLMFVWKDTTMLYSLCGQPSQLTRSEALVISMSETCKGICRFLHFWGFREENTLSIVDLSAWKPHCDSGYMRSVSFWRWMSMTRAKTMMTMLST